MGSERPALWVLTLFLLLFPPTASGCVLYLSPDRRAASSGGLGRDFVVLSDRCSLVEGFDPGEVLGREDDAAATSSLELGIPDEVWLRVRLTVPSRRTAPDGVRPNFFLVTPVEDSIC